MYDHRVLPGPSGLRDSGGRGIARLHQRMTYEKFTTLRKNPSFRELDPIEKSTENSIDRRAALGSDHCFGAH